MTADLGDGRQLHSVPPPGSGAVVTYILNILKNYNYNYEIDEADVETPLLYHRIAEAFKWAYALRTKLGDPFDDEYREYILEVRDGQWTIPFGLFCDIWVTFIRTLRPWPT